MEPASWERAKQIIAEAQALPPAEREAFVRRTCHDTPELCGEILPLLDDPEFSTRPLTASDLPDADSFDLVPGARVGPYIIVDRIGQGGMGQVFLATDPELRRRVALKCLLPSDSQSGLDRARILNEAIAAAAISHANVATVHHVIEHGDRMFIVMEYVEGENLAAKLRRERLPIDRILAIGRQLAAALKAAHEKGVIHRDIKPANIQIRMDGSVKVLDFGVARAARMLHASPDASTTIGIHSQPVLPIVARGGTPAYMSPEQLRGGAVDERSDLYSLGVVLFEMATGRRPFSTSDTAALVDAQAKGAPRADATQAGVPSALAEVIARALDANPAARYQSAAEIEQALEKLELDLVASSASLRARLLRSIPRVAVATTLGILALGAIGFITTVGFNRTFGRTGAFGVEPWPSYFMWGLLAVFPGTFIMTATAVIVLAARFGLRTLELVGPIGRLMGRARRSGRRVVLELGLNKPAGLAQALTGLAVATLVVLWWVDRDVINAWGSSFDSAPIETLLPIAESTTARTWYTVKFDVAMLAFGFGLFKVLQLRKRAKTRDGMAAIFALSGAVLIMVLMREWPYRTFFQRDFERVDFAGSRCYIIGQAADELLVLCPASDPPRNRTVRRDDPTLRRTGVRENVFRGVTDPRSSQ